MAFQYLKSLGSLLVHKHTFLKVESRFRRVNQPVPPVRLWFSTLRRISTDGEILTENTDFSQCEIIPEINFYRDIRNNFTEMSFCDPKNPYGPPLVILLPWQNMDRNILTKFMEFYGEKGFDIITVSVTKEQFMYPCFSGSAMNVVTKLLDYLNETHRHRPYIFHGFSIGVYLYGEALAQFSDNYDKYKTILSNVKGCLWDSPVDFLSARRYLGKFFYPKNCLRRFIFNMKVRSHFKKHYYDSVVYWHRARENFCCPVINVPNVFLMSCKDLISNPRTTYDVEKILKCNGTAVYKKVWWDSEHGRHFIKYCYEYTYGMAWFLSLSGLVADEYGKYKGRYAVASLVNLRLCKKVRHDFP